MQPVGGHAVYVDARRFLPHIPPLSTRPGARGRPVRGRRRPRLEIGTGCSGCRPDGTEAPAELDLLRLAMPRRVYTQSHADYVVEVFEEVVAAPRAAARLADRRSSRAQLRHFTARFEPME